jgi:hypothetical protein
MTCVTRSAILIAAGILSAGTTTLRAQPPAVAISGTVTGPAGAPLGDVLITLSGSASGATTTNGSGEYTFAGLAPGGTFTVAPARPGFTFSPGSRSFTNLTANQIANFGATAHFTIAGRVTDQNGTGLSGVTLTLAGAAGGERVSGANGTYAFSGVAGGAYTVTPSLDGVSFVPAVRNVTLTADHPDVSFTAASASAGTFRRFFAEGATGTFFDTEIALLNATDQTGQARVRFQKGDGTEVARDVTLPPRSRALVVPEALAGLQGTEFSTVVESDVPLVADRTMTWDGAGYGSHAETSLGQPQTEWFFAEGATTSSFSLFYLLQNPSPSAAEVEIRYLRPAPLPPIVKAYTLPPASRRTIFVNGEDPGLDEAEISAVIRVTNGVSIIAERAMYTNAGGRIFGAGHESAGLAAPSTRWFLAEGATGSFFNLFILVGNPNGVAANLEFRYLLSDGRAVTKAHTAAANSRLTIGVHTEDPALASAAVSTIVTSTNGVPVLVERAMWWPASGAEWYEGHNSAGAIETGTKWGLADGEVGGGRNAQTFILLANTGSAPASVRVTLVFDDGTTAEKTFAVNASSRFNVQVAAEFPQSMNRRFGAIVESLGPAPQPIVVERAVYSDAGGAVFAAGSNAVATRLRGEVGPIVVPPSLGTAGDASRAATQAVAAASGGSLTATAADGTAYSLQIPAGAVVDDVTITMTPLVGVAGLPAGSQFVAGVQFGPDGLQLYKPAILTITLPAGVDASQIAGLEYEGQGAAVRLTPMQVSGQTLTYFVTHFSGFLAATDFDGILRRLFEEAGNLPADLPFNSPFGPRLPAVVASLQAHYREHVRPALSAATASDARLNVGLREYIKWRWYLEIFDELDGPLSGELREAANLASAALRQGINRANARCVTSHNLAEANAALRWQAIAIPLGVAGAGSPLALETVLQTLCVEVRYEDTQFPAQPQPGTSAPLEVRAGFAFEDDGVIRHQPVHLTIEGRRGIVLADILRAGTSTAQGVYTDAFGIDTDATSEGIELRITTCLAAPTSGSHLRKVCQPAFIIRGLQVEPTTANVEPGGTQQFGARMIGTPTNQVQWSATGGTISSTGVYTAGSTAGSFSVTATSTVNPTLTARATVNVSAQVESRVIIFTSPTNPAIISAEIGFHPNLHEITRPIGDVAGFLAAVDTALTGVTHIAGVYINVSREVSLTLDVSGYTLTSEVSATAGCDPGATGSASVTVIAGTVPVRTLVRGCGTSTASVQAAVLDLVVLDPVQGGRSIVTAGQARHVQVSCVGGRVTASVSAMENLLFSRNDGCQATVTGQVGVHFGISDSVDSSFGTITGLNLRSTQVTGTRNTSFHVNAGNIVAFNGQPGNVIISGNVGVPLSAFSLGNVDGTVTITNNTGFTNAQAQAFVNARSVTGTVTISGNQP